MCSTFRTVGTPDNGRCAQ